MDIKGKVFIVTGAASGLGEGSRMGKTAQPPGHHLAKTRPGRAGRRGRPEKRLGPDGQAHQPDQKTSGSMA